MHPFVSMPKREYSKADEALMELQYVRHHIIICWPTVGRRNHLIKHSSACTTPLDRREFTFSVH